jgi:transposase
MGNPIMVGCDLHDRSMLLKVAIGDGEPRQMNYQNTPEGRRKMVDQLQRLGREEGSERIVFVYEASGQGFGLFDELADAGIECYVLAPTHLPKTPGSRRNKTDERDAQMLLEQCRAYVLAGNHLPTVWIPPPQLRDDRDLLRARLEAAEAAARVKLQTLALLKRNGIDLPDYYLKHRNWTKRFVGWLSEAAALLPSGAAAVLRAYLSRLQQFARELVELDRAVRRLADSPVYQAARRALEQICGVGRLTAMVFLTEMGDLTRFANRRQIAAYLGLCPSSFESGEHQDRKGHITHQGPARLRKVLCQAAWAGVRRDLATRRNWERIRHNNPKRGKKAIVAVMRRLAIRMWHLALTAGVDVALESPAEQVPRRAASG